MHSIDRQNLCSLAGKVLLAAVVAVTFMLVARDLSMGIPKNAYWIPPGETEKKPAPVFFAVYTGVKNKYYKYGFEFDWSWYDRTQYSVHSNECIMSVKVNGSFVKHLSVDGYRKYSCKGINTLDFAGYLKPGKNKVEFALRSGRRGETRIRIRPCYFFGFCFSR